MMRSKKAWIRIVEAFIAVMLILVVLISIYSGQTKKKSNDIDKTINSILDEIANDNKLRQDILDNKANSISVFVDERLPKILNFTVKICEIEDICNLPEYKKDVYANERIISSTLSTFPERIISSTLSTYSPKKVKLFVWEETRGEISRIPQATPPETQENNCSDGTLKNTCSINKPKYCNSDLILVDNCSFCGCSSGTCNLSGQCYNCIAQTCASLGKQCEIWSDNCGNNLDCGTCSGGKICSDSGICEQDTRISVTGCSVLNQENGKYKLDAPINDVILTYDSCIKITAKNITLDCQSHSNYIKSDDDWVGVYSNKPYTTIKNCNITAIHGGSGEGIKLDSANNSYVYNNILNNDYYGLRLVQTLNSKIEQINVSGNIQYGILLISSSNNTLTKINAENNTLSGVHLSSSDNNTLTNITANYQNTGTGISLYTSSNNILSSITTNNNHHGIYLGFSSYNNSLTNITSNYNYIGITLYTSQNNNLNSVTIKNSSSTGIYLSDSSNNNITKTIACYKPDYYDVYCASSSGNSGTGNTFGKVEACSDGWPSSSDYTLCPS